MLLRTHIFRHTCIQCDQGLTLTRGFFDKASGDGDTSKSMVAQAEAGSSPALSPLLSTSKSMMAGKGEFVKIYCVPRSTNCTVTFEVQTRCDFSANSALFGFVSIVRDFVVC